MNSIRENPEHSVKAEQASYLRNKVDVDSHEMVPFHFWGEEFGDVGDFLGKLDMKASGELRAGNSMLRPDISGDVTPINHDTVWNIKGPGAPSAIDLSRRPAVMEAMGIERQLVFPTFGLIGLILYYLPNPHEYLIYDPEGVDHKRLGKEACDAHNRWAARITKITQSKTRPVGMVLPDSIPEIMKQTEELLAAGIRGIMLPAGSPPAGTSPADPAMDPFWELLEKNDIPLTLHLGTEFAFMSSLKWPNNVPAFYPSRVSSAEFQVTPYHTSTLHFCMENYLVCMVLGGVFERFPRLRVGIIECAAHWVGPLAERMDNLASQFVKRLSDLSMPPSGYLARNVRATPFYFEPVDYYIDRYPHLAQVYAYATDYPHVEGGAESDKIFLDKLEGKGESVKEGFFRTNGLFLLPD